MVSGAGETVTQLRETEPNTSICSKQSLQQTFCVLEPQKVLSQARRWTEVDRWRKADSFDLYQTTLQ